MAGAKRKSAGDAPSPPPNKRGKTDANKSSASAPPAAADATTDPQEVLLSTSTSLFEYLERLPQRTLRSIYALPAPRGPTVAAAVIRSSCLTDMARQCALRLVACGGSFKVGSIVEGWIHRHGRRDRLPRLHANIIQRRIDHVEQAHEEAHCANQPVCRKQPKSYRIFSAFKNIGSRDLKHKDLAFLRPF